MARRFDRLGWAMDQDDLTPTQRFVLLIIADMANEIGECWPSKRTIMARTGYGATAVKDALRDLRAKEVIVVVPRFNPSGRQTSNSYVLCLEGRGRHTTPPTDVVDDDHELEEGSARDTSPDASRPPVEPPNRTARTRKTKTTTSSRSSRRAARARDDAEWADPAAAVFADEQEIDEDDIVEVAKATRGGPDSAWGLNGYYRNAVFLAGQGRVGNTNDGAMRKFFAEAKRCGVSAEELRMMVDAFVEDEQLFNRTATARWKVFIANAPLLQSRAEETLGVRQLVAKGEQTRGVPQHILDQILAS